MLMDSIAVTYFTKRIDRISAIKIMRVAFPDLTFVQVVDFIRANNDVLNARYITGEGTSYAMIPFIDFLTEFRSATDKVRVKTDYPIDTDNPNTRPGWGVYG